MKGVKDEGGGGGGGMVRREVQLPAATKKGKDGSGTAAAVSRRTFCSSVDGEKWEEGGGGWETTSKVFRTLTTFVGEFKRVYVFLVT